MCFSHSNCLHEGTDQQDDQAPQAAGQAKEDGNFDWENFGKEKEKPKRIVCEIKEWIRERKERKKERKRKKKED